uniref:non-specific serine/threonine protein kinase n=1 Tax=viral metagenome TaxID=1070528 RepID=A0A6C0EG08_9ZZZZ
MYINNKYKLISKLGSGSFGSIYKGENIRTKEHVAIKIEPLNANLKLLKNESTIYNYLKKFNFNGIPHLKWYGVDTTNYYMVISLLGDSINSYIEKNGKMKLYIVLTIGIKMLDIIKFIHDKGLIHRDIKPDNFLFGLNTDGTINTEKIYLIDFGFCKTYKTIEGEHVDEKPLTKIIGTPNYISLNIHNLQQPSRRDDVESIIYIMIYMIFGLLEWDSYSIEQIVEMKEKLHNNPNTPDIIRQYLLYVRTLNYDEEPIYDYNIFMK